MFLKNLRMKNVRSLRDIELDFVREDGSVRQWTMLLGENGCGKSSVLRSVALVLAGSEALVELLGDPNSWIRNGTKTAQIDAVVTTVTGEERHVSLVLKRDHGISDVLRQNEESLRLLDDALKHSVRNYLTLGYGVSRRAGSNVSLQMKRSERFRHPRARSMATLFDSSSELISLESWAMGLEYRKGSQAIKTVRSVFEGLLPGVSFKSIDREQGQLLFSTADGTVPLRQMSDGYQNVIAWVGDLLYQITNIFDDYKDPMKARGLLLLDELGLHLHPTWQRKLIDFLSSKLPNIQFLVTTHSPLTAHQAGEGELYFLKRNKSGKAVEIHPFVGSPNLLLLHQLILSPAFGIDTVQSAETEQTEEEYKALKRKKRKSAADARRLKKLEEKMEEVTAWDELTPKDKDLRKLLEKIEGKLQITQS